MTTSVKVLSHNYPARVETYDQGKLTSERIVLAGDGDVDIYCTTSRELRIVDLEYDHPAVLAEKAKRAEKQPALTGV